MTRVPYSYRNMTSEEREQALRARLERGYPLHAPPHPYRASGQYLLTAANFEHAPIMASPLRCADFEGRLLEAMEGIAAAVQGWVILPNHYHILAGVRSLDDVSVALNRLHGTTSRQWNLEDGLTGERRVWYRFTDRVIRDDNHYFRTLNYIHYNPVKHRYVDDPYAWPWTSLHNYVSSETYGRDWLRRMWRDHPPGNFGRGWDDEGKAAGKG